ncbi:MAG: 30S ribosome-binding factor RbfA [Bacteroidia bacterium]
MASQRLEKISALFQRELSQIFQRESRTLAKGAMVSVTVVRVSPDLSTARVYVSIFGVPNKDEVLVNIRDNAKTIRYTLAQIVKNQLRKTPELHFYLDDSIDYAQNINELLKK